MATSSRLVLDASYALESILPTHAQWQAESVDLFDRIASGELAAHVPWLFFAECAGVVTRRIRDSRRRLDPEIGRSFLSFIDGLGLLVEPPGNGAAALHANAVRWNVGTYDAVYLDLALRLRAPLATRDRGPIAAAAAAGLVLFELTA